jgi:hypothetical protein
MDITLEQECFLIPNTNNTDSGAGNPQNIQTDNVALEANGTAVTCSPAISIAVLSPAGTYTMSCGGATVNGFIK